jgi:uncharacterized protein
MAAVKELSVAEKLKQLYELQMIDSELDQIGVLKGELPMEVADLEDEIAGLDTRIQRMKNQVKEADVEAKRHEANIKDANGHIDRYTKQLDNVKNNREFEALQKEIENQKLEIQLSEKRNREHKAIAVQKQELLTTTELRFTQKNKDLDNKKIELAQIIEKTEKEEEKYLKKTEKARKKIEDRLLAAYDKTRKSYRNGLAVVKVERDSCGGCFNKVPAQIQIEIALRKKIVACEHCGRVLVDNDILNSSEDYVPVAVAAVVEA